MQFIFGLLTAVVFFILLLTALYFGYRLGNKQTKPKPQEKKENDEEVRKATKLHEDFMKLMNYNESVALQRKKVE